MINNTPARPNFNVVTLDIDRGMPLDLNISGTIKLDKPPFLDAVPRWVMPTYKLGSLIVVISKGQITHTGMVIDEFQDSDLPSFTFYVEPLAETVLRRQRQVERCKCQRVMGRAYQYIFKGSVNQQVFTGKVSKLCQEDADHLRAQIATVTPTRMLDIFWTQCERDAILAAEMAQNRYTELASKLLDELSY
jgi:hypothetical protein